MGILNSLTMLEASIGGELSAEMSPQELIAMTRRNAQYLHQNLASLLDLAAIESGVFNAKLREVEFSKLVLSRVQANPAIYRDRELKISVEEGGDASHPDGHPLLGDPQKLSRAVDLCLQILVARAEKKSTIKVRISSTQARFQADLDEVSAGLWESNWSQALAGFHGGVLSPGSAFAGTMATEQAFLSRMQEGLGSEMILVHEIMRRHQAKFESQKKGAQVTISLELPELSSEEGLHAVLASRTLSISPEQGALGSVALCLVRPPQGSEVQEFRAELKDQLFRVTDAAYALPQRGEVALVVDDCKPDDIPRLMTRIEKKVGSSLQYGAVVAPMDGVDPSGLISLAQKRLDENKR